MDARKRAIVREGLAGGVIAVDLVHMGSAVVVDDPALHQSNAWLRGRGRPSAHANANVGVDPARLLDLGQHIENIVMLITG